MTAARNSDQTPKVGRVRGSYRAKPSAVLINLQQASEEYGPSYTSLRDLVKQGHLPAVQLGEARRIWVRRADIEQLIARSTERAA